MTKVLGRNGQQIKFIATARFLIFSSNSMSSSHKLLNSDMCIRLKSNKYIPNSN